MKGSKILIAIMLVAAGNLFAMEGSQKSENYGYYETTETVDKPVLETPKKVLPVNADQSSNQEKAIQNTPSVNSNNKAVELSEEAESIDIDHSAFDALLRRYVSVAGNVDYAAIKSNISQLDDYLGYLSQNVPASSSSKNERLAFWINAYNANTIKLIVDNYPVNSIMDLYGGKAFDKKWIKIGGETLSLNDIENNKIRAKFNEPRIHFAVNCAAKSCPPILNKAWTAENVQSTLEARTIAFVNDAAYNKISKGSVQISKIFEWYAKDFPSDIVNYLNKYSQTSINSGAKVGYIEYDWALNK